MMTAVLQSATKLRPEDFGFQVLSPGQRSDPGRRPFYPTYISRSAVDMRTNRTYDDKSWIEELRQGRSFVLFAEPLGGKSRTLFEIAKRMEGYEILSPKKGGVVPSDDIFSTAGCGVAELWCIMQA